MSADGLKKEFVSKYLSVGEQKFYRFLLVYSLNKLILINKGDSVDQTPDLELLDYHNRFIILYRREGEEVYLRLARLFRKAAHKIYRIMLKKGMTAPNAKFLNLV
jgi:hypothetical protein